MPVRTIKKLIVVLVITLFSFVLISECSNVYAAGIANTENQYMELKAVEIKDIEGAERQVILEWWSYNLSFKGLDLRFSYDFTKVQPSNIQDNSIVDFSNGESSFVFANDFASYMDYMVISAEDGEYRCVMSLEEYDEAGTYIENDEILGYVVNTNVTGGVLIGKMSFRLADGAKLNQNTFALKAGGTSPKTGIQIAQTAVAAYEDPSVFRFTVLSDDAKLKTIQYNFFNYIIEENGTEALPELIYEDLDLTTPDADSTDTVSKYTINLNENLDNISLKLEKSYEFATVKIKDEEIDVTNSKEIKLNKLGEEDTVIDIVVTAEDGETTLTYKLVIHRPYGTIKGSITTSYTYETTGKYLCNIYTYNHEDVEKVFDWDTRIGEFEAGLTTDTINADLHTIQEVSKVTTKDDGTFEIKVIPGTYDILQDKSGYLDHIYIYLTVAEGDVKDLGNYDLVAGDSNKDGLVQIRDKVLVVANNGKTNISPDYDEACDFNNDGEIQLRDKVIVTAENGKSREIVDYRN